MIPSAKRLSIRTALTVALACIPPASQGAFSESPDLAIRVEAGTLPPLAERIPRTPLIISAVEKPGAYGGTWRMGLDGYGHGPLLSRTLGYEQLVRWDRNWIHVLPNLATSWTIEENARVYEFRLRRGVRWSDGHPFTALDIVAWVEDVASDPGLHPVPPAWLVADGAIPECTMPDDYTVRFRFPAPNALFLEQLAGMRANEMTRYPAHYFRRFHCGHNPEGARRLMAETGMDWPDAFRTRFTPWTWRNHETPTLDAWTLATPYKPGVEKLVAVRNPYYWKIDTLGRQLPYIDRVEFFVGTQPEIVAAALDGRIDFQRDLIKGDEGVAPYEKAETAGTIRLVSVIPSIPNPMAISLNLTHPDPAMRAALGNREIRIALSEAIDREAIIREFYGEESFPWQVAPRKNTPFSNTRLGQQHTEFRPRRSEERLEAEGLHRSGSEGTRLLKDGRPFRINLLVPSPGKPEWPAVLERIRDSWHEIGVGLDWEILPRGDFYEAVDANRHDGAVWWSGGGLSPALEPEYYVPATFERLGPLRVFYGVPWARWFLDPEAPDAETPPEAVREQLSLFREVMATPDRDRRAMLMKGILDMAVDRFYVIGICHAPRTFAIRTPEFRNVPTTIINSWLYPDPGPSNPCQFFIDPDRTDDE